MSEDHDEDNDEESDHDEGDSDSDIDEQDDSDTSDDDSEDGLTSYPRRYKQKTRVAYNVPTSSHLRRYVGHCNVDTTKDVNFYGLNDEYVVSGSDDGNLFIWEKKNSRLVNILQGDNEVVNVIQRKLATYSPFKTMFVLELTLYQHIHTNQCLPYLASIAPSKSSLLTRALVATLATQRASAAWIHRPFHPSE